MATDNEVLKRVEREMATSKRWPISVYRLQFNRFFTFRDAAKLVPYLSELGITDCYCSPYLKARPGSLHGYDITDHNSLNPEIGSERDFNHFVQRLRKHNMGQLLDFVPNHMGIFGNPRWQDVLENGPSSIYARFFDIDWKPIKKELHQRVLLPILEDFYGNVLKAKQLQLDLEQGTFKVKYWEHQLPVCPKTTVIILEPCADKVREALGDQDADYLELQSIITACRNLPDRSETAPERITERQREKEIVKRRLGELSARNESVKGALNEVIRLFNGRPGDGQSFGRLHELLEGQAYRLSYWRVAADEINYRRFFDINDLIALHQEDPVVFDETHRLVRELVSKGILSGIRIDHIDGLFDPPGYLWQLQKAGWLDLALGRLQGQPQYSDIEVAEQKLAQRFEQQRQSHPDSAASRPLFVIVEKVLGRQETLREAWPTDGTTGYEYMAALNGLFVDGGHRRATLDTYQWFTGLGTGYQKIVYQCKNLVMRTAMAAELNVLAYQLDRISERSWQYRDFTLNSLRDAIREVIACYPVYRTYINAYAGLIDERDEAIVISSVREAERHNPVLSSAIFEFLRKTLLLQYPAGTDEAGHNEQNLFVMRFQQFTGPVMAKGVEDTASYIYNPLISLCEVGGSPQQFGVPVEEFHRQNIQRHQAGLRSFNATSTHDSKRGEDTRARINVLSEIPEEWRSALNRWGGLNKDKKMLVDGEPAPDRNEEYLIYQTLLGTYPLREMTHEELAAYSARIRDYMLKAIREAKVHTSWISPNTAYEEAVTKFVTDILELSSAFLTDFESLNGPVATCGMYNSLSQVVLKIFSPGVPDIYQGNELWAFNLTDPDNRRSVDFEHRKRLLKELRKEVAASHDLARLAETLLTDSHDGRVKLYVTWRSLNYRRDNSGLFSEGKYVPLNSAGAKKNHLCAFAWQKGKQQLVVAAPRLVAGLTGDSQKAPTGNEVWGNTYLMLPRRLTVHTYRNIFTGETANVRKEKESENVLRLADVFKTFPVAALEPVIA